MQGLRYYKVPIYDYHHKPALEGYLSWYLQIGFTKGKVMKIPHSAPSSDSPNRLHSHSLSADSLENQSGVLEH